MKIDETEPTAVKIGSSGMIPKSADGSGLAKLMTVRIILDFMAEHYKEWYQMYNNKGLTQAQIAEKYDVDPSTVSKGISTYEEGLKDGKENSSPSDFETDALKSELETRDEMEDEDSYNCGECDSRINYGDNPCPDCGAKLNWAGVE